MITILYEDRQLNIVQY